MCVHLMFALFLNRITFFPMLPYWCRYILHWSINLIIFLFLAVDLFSSEWLQKVVVVEIVAPTARIYLFKTWINWTINLLLYPHLSFLSWLIVYCLCFRHFQSLFATVQLKRNYILLHHSCNIFQSFAQMNGRSLLLKWWKHEEKWETDWSWTPMDAIKYEDLWLWIDFLFWNNYCIRHAVHCNLNRHFQSTLN